MKRLVCFTFALLWFAAFLHAQEKPVVINLEDTKDGFKVRVGGGWEVDFSPDGKKVIASNTIYNGEHIIVYDADTGKILSERRRDKQDKQFGDTFKMSSFAISRDGKKFVLSGTIYVDYSRDIDITQIWDSETGKELRKLVGHTRIVNATVFSPDEKKIATGSYDKTARIWDAETGKELKKLVGHTSEVNSVSFSPDGKKIVTGSSDKTVRIWDDETGKLLKTLDGKTEIIWSAVFSPDSKKILVRYAEEFGGNIKKGRTASVWDVETGKELYKLEQRLKNGDGSEFLVPYSSIDFSPDSKLIVTADSFTGDHNETIQIRDAETGKVIRTMEGRKNHAWSAQFSPDGKKIVTAQYDGYTRLWDVETGKELRHLQAPSAWPTYFDYPEKAVFSPDGKKVAIVGTRGYAVIWVLE